jgi:hypothetical protein
MSRHLLMSHASVHGKGEKVETRVVKALNVPSE